MRWLPVIFLAAATTAAPLIAQTPAVPESATCETGTAEAYLDANNVNAKILNTGGLFWNGSDPVYEVPKGSGINAVFSSALWMGGMVDGELRMSASRYGPWEMWPGPVGATLEECADYDRIFEINALDLDVWHETGQPTLNMIEWPWHMGAPVTDGDGIIGNYNLVGGDHPELLGDETHWWIMNDAGGEHRATKTEPLGLEVAATVFTSSLSPLLSHTTFYRYELTYKGAEPLKDAYVSLFMDVDLGAAFDDYVGSDTTLGVGFFYNGDDNDEGAYGNAPPALGAVILDAPVAWPKHLSSDDDQDLRTPSYLTAFKHFYSGGGGHPGDPTSATAFYQNMQGNWSWGEHMTVGGVGIGYSNEETAFAYPGMPGEFWSELNIDRIGSQNHPSDRRALISNGPFDLDPGETATFYFAIVWSRGSSNIDSVRQLKVDAAIVKQVAALLLKPTYSYDPEIPPEPEYVFGVNDVYPNPTSGIASLEYSLPQPMRVRLAVFDVLGRRVHDSGDAVREAGEYTARFDTSGWPAGVYTARLQLDHITTTRTFTVVK